MAEEEKKVLRPAPRASSHADFHTHSRVTPIAVGRRCGDGRSLQHRAPIRNQEVERRLHVRVGLAPRARARRARAPLGRAERTWPARVDRSRDSEFFFSFARPWGIRRWSWDICADTCAICRNSLNEPSIEYQANPSPNNENGLSIAFGCCGRASRSRLIALLLCPRISVTRTARSPPQTCSIWTASSAGSRPAPCAHSATKSGSSQRSSGSRDTDHSAETPAVRT